MANSTVRTVLSTIPELEEVTRLLAAPMQQLCEAVRDFRRQPPTPERTCAFEKKRRPFSGRQAECS